MALPAVLRVAKAPEAQGLTGLCATHKQTYRGRRGRVRGYVMRMGDRDRQGGGLGGLGRKKKGDRGEGGEADG